MPEKPLPAAGSVPRSRGLHQISVVVFVFITLTTILSLKLLPPDIANVNVGDVSPRDIEAPRNLEIIDDRATREARQHAEESVTQVYRYNDEVKREVSRTLEKTVAELMKLQLQPLELPEQRDAQIDRLSKTLPVELSPTSIHTLTDPSLNLHNIKILVWAVLKPVEEGKIPEYQLEEARKGVADSLKRDTRLPARLREAVSEMASRCVQPTLLPDVQATAKAKQEKMMHVEPIKQFIRQGQMIVRRGDFITAEHMAILDALGLHKPEINKFNVLANALFVSLIIFVVGIYLAQQETALLSQPRLLWLLAIIVVVVLAMCRGGVEMNHNLAPIATASLLLSILLDYRLALLVTSLIAVCIGVMTSEFGPCAVSMITGQVAVLSVTHVTRRGDLIIASLVVWLVNMLSLLVVNMWSTDSVLNMGYSTVFYGTLNGVFASVLAVGALPFLENIFMVTTNIRLVELANPVEPLLQRLMTEAPGTYHHSMIVANLAEGAARAITADALLAKVGAYYHDIGKMKAAHFFVENQLGQENPHDRLNPSLSAHIIISHVRDGMEMARGARLPQIVADFIDMHHGDRLVSYFYHKALQKGEACTESDFRYHGRRPRTRETAIVMMADTIEAKARLLAKPNQENLDKMVRESIKHIVDDGQLDDSNLTLRDIQQITQAFVKTLMGIYHSRIEYPKEVEGLGSRESKPAESIPSPR